MNFDRLEWARWVARHPEWHSSEGILRACSVLDSLGDPADVDTAFRLRNAVEVIEGNGAAWGVIFAFAGIMLGALIAWLLSVWIDWAAVLRFVAPTAFETRPIEVIIGGTQP